MTRENGMSGGTLKVLVGPTAFGDSGDEPLRLLASHGVELVRNPHGRGLRADEVVSLGADCVAILAGAEPLGAEVLEKLPALRCISRCGAGLDSIDLQAANARGIRVFNTPDALTRAVAELALGLLLALLRRIPLADRSLRRGEWRKETGSLLLGRTVGVVGLGRIGRAFAAMLKALGCTVLASDPYADASWAAAQGIELLPLDELLARSDVVSLHVALSPETRGLIGAAEIARMRDGALLVNVSRGEVVDEEALLVALRTGRLGGAALDVFRTEPYRGPLTELDTVVLTPHIGSRAREAKLSMEIEAVRNLLDGLSLMEQVAVHG